MFNKKKKQKGKEIVQKTNPLLYENYENLDRDEKFDLVVKKSLQLIEFSQEHNIDNYMFRTYLMG